MNKMNFKTLSILPATISNTFNDICTNCQNSIIFREDLNPEYKDMDSAADVLQSDISHFSTLENRILEDKLGVNDIKEPTSDCLDLLKRISARCVGLGSVYVPKLYGKKDYHGAIT